MTARIYRAWNGPAPTTASQAAVTTGTAIKTMLQVAAPAGFDLTIVGWGFSMDGAAAAAGVQWELLTTGSVAATVTALSAANLTKVNIPSGPDSGVTFSTTTTGYTATAEGSITTTEGFDSIFMQPTGGYVHRWPLGSEPVVPVSTILRVRVKAAAAVNAICWVEWAE